MLRKRKGPVIKPAENWRMKIHSFPARTCSCIFLKYNLTYKLHLLMFWTLLWMSQVRSCSGENNTFQSQGKSGNFVFSQVKSLLKEKSTWEHEKPKLKHL